MAEQAPAQRLTSSLAIVGLACRFPDADDAPGLLDVVLTGRRAFRRIPPVRFDLAEYFQADPDTTDATYSTRAALLEGWQFDCAAFGIEPDAYAAADPALWLTLETAARALAGAGLTGGTGLDRDRTGVIIGNTLGGDTSRANALRGRWPYVRRVLSEALADQQLPPGQTGAVLRRAERQYLAPFPPIGPATLAGSTPGTIAAAICSYFGFRGGSHAIDSTCSSSTQAVASACTALAAGEIDAAVAGGVDISLDPLELIGLAKAGVLACDEVRIYDEEPDGYLPAEGCGIVVMMRTADARAAGLPVYAEIIGWGASAASHAGEDERRVSSQLLAMQRAYDHAGLDPRDIQLFEGNGTGIRDDDDAELAALGVLRQGASAPAVLGSVKANIGHAKAAAGAASLIKTVLAVSNGVLPPATGVRRPHPMITEGDAALVLPHITQEWPEGVRHAAVSTLNSAGANVHLVLRSTPAGRPRQDRGWRARLMPARSLDTHDPVIPRLMPDASEPVPYLLHAPDQFALAAVLGRLASIARWLSDAELQDLACTLGRDAGPQGRSRVAIVAAGQEQLGALAAEAAGLLPELAGGLLAVRPGIFAAEDGDGRVTLLLSDVQPEPDAAEPLADPVRGCLDALRWLEALDVHAAGAVGHGMGALAGLAWAGVLGQEEVIEIADLRARFLHRSGTAPMPAGEDGPADDAGTEAASSSRPGHRVDSVALRAAIAQKYRFGPPRRRLISTFTGEEIDTVDDAIDLICSGFAGAAHIADAIAEGSIGATLLLETGPGSALAEAARARSSVPVVGLPAGIGDPAGSARVAAALFAAGALGQPPALFAGRPGRPIDIWRDRTYIVSPCEIRPEEPARATPRPGTAVVPAAAQDTAAAQDAAAADDAPAPAEPVPAETVPAEPVPAAAAAQPAEAAAMADVAPEAEAAPPESADVIVPAPRQDPAPVLPATEASPADSKAAPPSTVDPSTVDPTTGEDSVEARASRARLERQADLRAALKQQLAEQVAGAGRWARCYAEIVRPAEHPARRAKSVPWRLHVSGNRAQLAAARSVFRANPGAARTLAVISDPADRDGRAVAVQAAREAADTGQLVVVTTSPDFTGFFAGLHAEHPEIGITVLRVPETNGIRLAPKYAHAVKGQFRELILAPDGSAGEPAMSELELTGGAAFPLGPDDVVLVNHGARGAGLALAQVLACCGTAVAVIGRSGEDDRELSAGLEELRLAGARVGYETVDPASPTSLAAAVQRVEAELGPVTAIGHAVSPSDPAPLLDLTDTEISDPAANEVAMLDRLVGTVRTGQLRMIITFGSVAGRYGMAGAAVTALSSAALAARAAELASAGNGRSLHIDIPGWSPPAAGEQRGPTDYVAAAGNTPVDVSAVSRLLVKIMTTQELPERIALHGRVSGPAARFTSVPAVAEITAAQLAGAGLPTGGRFLTNILVHYPGIELVCAPTLALETDPYLADYEVDGLPMLPPALAIEALAQAASVLAGTPVRSAGRVRLESPIVIPAGGLAELRICAVREGARITTVLRCGDSSFTVDHARADFACTDEDDLSPAVMPPVTAQAALAKLAGQTGFVDGAEMYGPISFQEGRFRRIALLPEVTTTSCRALARGADDQLWFAPGSAYADPQFLLGSPGLADATLQVLQASVPHRRLRAAGCTAARFSGRAAEGAVEIWASAVQAPSTVPAQGGAPGPESAGSRTGAPVAAPASESAPAGVVPAQGRAPAAESAPARPRSKKARREQRQQARAAQARSRSARPGPTQAAVPEEAAPSHPRRPAVRLPAEQIGMQRWDIDAVDAAGHLLLSWRGVELHDAGPLPRHSAWPPPLLGVYLERASRDAGLDDSLRVVVNSRQPDAVDPRQLAASDPDPEAHETPTARFTAADSRSVPGFELAVSAAVPVACAWSVIDAGNRQEQPPAAIAAVYAGLRAQLDESPVLLAARLRAISACIAVPAEPDGNGSEAAEDRWAAATAGEGWIALQAGAVTVACALAEVSGVPGRVAVAIATSRVAMGPVAPSPRTPAGAVVPN